MTHYLPRQVRIRPKTPALGDNMSLLLRQPEMVWLDNFQSTPNLSKYICRDGIDPICGISANTAEAWVNLRPISLNHWLQHFQSVPEKLAQEISNELTLAV
jgi:hypothetical protein